MKTEGEIRIKIDTLKRDFPNWAKDTIKTLEWVLADSPSRDCAELRREV